LLRTAGIDLPTVTLFTQLQRYATGSGAPSGVKNGNYSHGRFAEEVAATRLWLREAAHTLRELNKGSG
jgi:hypothetical protein